MPTQQSTQTAPIKQKPTTATSTTATTATAAAGLATGFEQLVIERQLILRYGTQLKASMHGKIIGINAHGFLLQIGKTIAVFYSRESLELTSNMVIDSTLTVSYSAHDGHQIQQNRDENERQFDRDRDLGLI